MSSLSPGLGGDAPEAFDLTLLCVIVGTKTPTKPKGFKVQKSGGLQSSDNNAQCSSLYVKRWVTVKELSFSSVYVRQVVADC